MILHDYQHEAVKFMVLNRRAALLADPGLGKTLMALTAINWFRLAEPGLKVLIVAPLRVIYSVWPTEVEKWGFPFKCQILHGKNKKIDLDNDIFLVNPEGLKAIFAQKDASKLQALFVDESSQFKSWSAVRTKLLRSRLKQFDIRVIMTGTPAPKSCLDLFAQIFLLDEGEALGANITRFRRDYAVQGYHCVHVWNPRPNADVQIREKIQHLTYRLDGERLLNLPEFIYHNITVELPEDRKEQYRMLHEDLCMYLDDGRGMTAKGVEVAYGKCRQFAGGAVLHEGEAEWLHTAKYDALMELLGELGGKPVIIVYNYIHELQRLKVLFPHAPFFGGGVSAEKGQHIVDMWNQDQIKVLLVHPAAMSHGLNLQYGSGRHIIWLTLTDDLEKYQQLNRRIRRQGVTGNVFVYHIITRGTVDVALLRRLREKDAAQWSILEALRHFREDSDAG